MALQNFPQHFTHTITVEVHVEDDRPSVVIIRNTGNLDEEALVAVADAAVVRWDPRAHNTCAYQPEDVDEDDMAIFSVHARY